MAETNKELLETLATQLRMVHNMRRDLAFDDLCARDPQLKVTWDKVLARMCPDEPLKTEETTFGALSVEDRFLGDVSRQEYLVCWDKELARLRSLSLLRNEVLDYAARSKVHKILM